MSEEATLDEFVGKETEERDVVDVGSLQQLEESPISEWTLNKLGSLLTLEYGDNLPSGSREDGDIPVFGSNGQVDTHSEPAIDEPGIIMGRKGSIGEIEFSEKPFWPIDTTYYLTRKETEENLRFLYYLLQNIQLERLNAASAIPGLNRDDAYGLNALVPPLPEQRKIATILYTVDQAIEKTERVTRHYEDLQTGLLREHFGKSSVQVDYPEERVDKRLGPKTYTVPEDWEIVQVADVGEVVTGDTPSTKNEDYFGGDLPFVTPEDFGDSKRVFRGSRSLTDEGRQKARPIPEGSVMMDCIGMDMGKVRIAGQEIATNQQINSVIVDSGKMLPEFLYFHLKAISNLIQSQAGQTRTPIVSKSQFSSFEIFNPPTSAQRDIVNSLNVFDDLIEKESDYTTQLRRLKRGLQQDLLSGTVRTTDTNIEVPDEVVQYG